MSECPSQIVICHFNVFNDKMKKWYWQFKFQIIDLNLLKKKPKQTIFFPNLAPSVNQHSSHNDVLLTIN